MYYLIHVDTVKYLIKFSLIRKPKQKKNISEIICYDKYISEPRIIYARSIKLNI